MFLLGLGLASVALGREYSGHRRTWRTRSVPRGSLRGSLDIEPSFWGTMLLKGVCACGFLACFRKLSWWNLWTHQPSPQHQAPLLGTRSDPTSELQLGGMDPASSMKSETYHSDSLLWVYILLWHQSEYWIVTTGTDNTLLVWAREHRMGNLNGTF